MVATGAYSSLALAYLRHSVRHNAHCLAEFAEVGRSLVSISRHS